MGQPGVADGKAGLAQYLPVRRHRPPAVQSINRHRILTELLGDLGSCHQTGRPVVCARCRPALQTVHGWRMDLSHASAGPNTGGRRSIRARLARPPRIRWCQRQTYAAELCVDSSQKFVSGLGTHGRRRFVCTYASRGAAGCASSQRVCHAGPVVGGSARRQRTPARANSQAEEKPSASTGPDPGRVPVRRVPLLPRARARHRVPVGWGSTYTSSTRWRNARRRRPAP